MGPRTCYSLVVLETVAGSFARAGDGQVCVLPADAARVCGLMVWEFSRLGWLVVMR